MSLVPSYIINVALFKLLSANTMWYIYADILRRTLRNYTVSYHLRAAYLQHMSNAIIVIIIIIIIIN